MKSSLLSVEPEIFEHTIDYEEDEFAFISSDGLLEVFSIEEICNFITYNLKLQSQPPNMCQKLIEFAKQSRKSNDNMACALIHLKYDKFKH